MMLVMVILFGGGVMMVDGHGNDDGDLVES